LAGFSAPDAANAPPMKHPAVHDAASQTVPLPHAAPVASGDHAVVDVSGWHERQAFAPLTAPLNSNAPPTKQPRAQAPEWHTRPAPHANPSAAGVHAVVEAVGSHF
jgi:hypothetical protein